MENTKFTKGKWEFVETPSVLWFDVLDENGKNVLRSDLLGREQVEANAKLIAAAPEMFEMLKKIIYSTKNEMDYVKSEIEQLLTKITE